MKHLFIALCVAVSVFSLCTSDAKAASSKDIQILSRALSFIENGPTGDVNIGVVYDASTTEADEILSLIGTGITSGKIKLHAQKVSAQDAKDSQYPVLLFTEGTDTSQKAIFDAVNNKGIITVSMHDTCLNNSNCVLVVRSEPKVDIKVSSAAAETTGVSFGSAFRMMISEQ